MPLWRRTPLVRSAGEDEMLRAARLIGVAGHFNGAVIAGGLAFDEALRIEGAGPATAVGHALGDAAAVGAREPGEVQHLSERDGAEVEVKPCDKNVVVFVEQVLDEEKKIFNKLAFIDRNAFHPLAYFLFRVFDRLKDLPWVAGPEFDGVHFAVSVGVSALNHSGAALGVIARFEDQHILARVLAAHFGAPQQFGGLVAPHRTQHEFQFSSHEEDSLAQNMWDVLLFRFYAGEALGRAGQRPAQAWVRAGRQTNPSLDFRSEERRVG